MDGLTELMGFQFPRAILYLEPDSLELSDTCKVFLDKHKDVMASGDAQAKNEVLQRFFQRFGRILLSLWQAIEAPLNECCCLERRNDRDSSNFGRSPLHDAGNQCPR